MRCKKNELLIISGPTASGKTKLSVNIALKESTVVVSADSRQFYKELNIGTAKPSIEERKGVKHYFIDSHRIHDHVNATRFANEASILIEKLFLKYEKIVLTGGSGLFIDALCYGIDNIPHDPDIQQQLNEIYLHHGTKPLLDELQEFDPEYFQQVDKNNHRRIIRAIEAMRLTKQKYSQLRTKTPKINKFDIKHIIIEVPRNELYKRINDRVDTMIKNGLEQEARSLLQYRNLKSLQTVGYAEWFDFFDGTIDRQTCIDRIKQNTRRYAKRQLTWLKRYKDVSVIKQL